MEKVAWIVGLLDLLQPWQIGAVIRILPVGQVGVNVVYIRAAAGIGAHGLPRVVKPAMICRYN